MTLFTNLLRNYYHSRWNFVIPAGEVNIFGVFILELTQLYNIRKHIDAIKLIPVSLRYTIQNIAISNHHNIWSCAHLTQKRITARPSSSYLDNYYNIQRDSALQHFCIKKKPRENQHYLSALIICWNGDVQNCWQNVDIYHKGIKGI